MFEYKIKSRITIEQIKQHPWYKGETPNYESIFFEMNRRLAVTEKIKQEEKRIKKLENTRRHPQHYRQGYRGGDVEDSDNKVLNQAQKEDADLVLEKKIETYDPESNLDGEYFFLNDSPDMIAALIKAFCDDDQQIELL